MSRRQSYIALAIVIAAYIALGLVYSTVTPIFEGPDEVAHFEYVRFLVENRTLPSEARAGMEGYVQSAGHPPLYHFLGALLTGWIDTSGDQLVRNPYFGYGTDALGAYVFRHTAQENFPYQGTTLAVHLLRGLSLLFGAGTIVAAFFLARTFSPQENWLALGAAAFVAFLPQFLFMTSIANNDNAVNFLSAASMVQILRIGKGEANSTRDFVLLGSVIGLANIAKGSASALLPVGGLAILLGCRTLARRELARYVGLALVAFFAVAGWWYLRNILVHGDPLALSWYNVSLAEFRRNSPVSFEEVSDTIAHLGQSFWARFGWANISLDTRMYDAFGIAAGIAFLGLVIRVLRDYRLPDFPRRGMLLLGADILCVAAVVASFSYTYPFSASHGRYLFTALPALAIFFVYGLSGLLPKPYRWIASAVTAGRLLIVAIWVPFMVLVPAYQPYVPPAAITRAQMPADAVASDILFNDSLRVAAFKAPSTVQRGADAIVRVYWEPLTQIETDNNVGLSLVSANGTVLWTRARRPGRGLSPSDMWQPNTVIPDLFTVRVPNDAPPGDAYFVVSVAERGGDGWRDAQDSLNPTLATVTIQ